MIDAAKIEANMEVKGSDGKHVGTVLGVDKGRVMVASGGIDHVIDVALVDAVQNRIVRLRTTAAEAVRAWH
jgi:hypothetical protein